MNLTQPSEKYPDSALVVAIKDQVCCDLADEVVVLNLQDGVYYGLNAVGAGIWELIQKAKTVGEIRDWILREYQVVAEQCDQDLHAFLQEMAARKLIEIRNGEND